MVKRSSGVTADFAAKTIRSVLIAAVPITHLVVKWLREIEHED
jgi:hypothetical protein